MVVAKRKDGCGLCLLEGGRLDRFVVLADAQQPPIFLEEPRPGSLLDTPTRTLRWDEETKWYVEVATG